MITLSNLRGNGRSVIRYTDIQMNAYKTLLENLLGISTKEISSSPSINFFEGILRQVFDTTVLTDPALVAYDRHVRLSSRNANRTFDTFGSGVGLRTNVLVKGNTTEYHIPTQGLIGTSVQILDDWDKWEDIKPVVLAVSDSGELPTLQRSTQITYKEHAPSYCVFCIDTAAILMKFIKYMQANELNFDTVNLPEFIVNHITIPMMEESILNTWGTECVSKVLTMDTFDITVTPIVSKSQLSNGIKVIDDLFGKYLGGNITLADFINTDLCFNTSLVEHHHKMNTQYAVLPGSRYIAADFLKNATFIEIIAHLLTYDINGKNSGLLRTMQTFYKVLARSRWESHVPNAITKAQLSEVVQTLSNM